jgi:predicted P-loop ATPase
VCAELRLKIYSTYGFDTGKLNVGDALFQLACQNKFHPVFDYFNGIEWDRNLRLNRWMVTYLGAPDTPFIREVSRISLIAAVKRIKYPGTKFDQIIVLEGPQGTGKSSALRILAVDEQWFSDQSIFGVEDRQQQELLSGKWIYEAAELQGLQTTQAEKIKAFASRQVDRARPAYGRFMEERPRTCIIFGTTNSSKYLGNDGNGHRRIWPIPTGKIDLNGLRANVDQLWAEAWFRDLSDKEEISLHAALWKTATAEQDARVQHDAWEEKIDSWLTQNMVQETSIFRIATGALEIPAGRISKSDQTRIGHCLTSLGWIRRRGTVDGKREYLYDPPRKD